MTREARADQGEISELRRMMGGLSSEQRTLLGRRLTAMARRGNAIPRRETAGPCPLSFAQQRLWFLDQVEPHGCLYNVPHAVRLRGPLQLGALQEALNAVVARHESLRTTFIARDGEPVQVVAERGVVELLVRDLRGVPAARREEELKRALRAEARRPFNLEVDLMLRALAVRLEGEHVLLLTAHHIAADGWSMDILLRELSEAYAASVGGRAPDLPPLPIQYGDYAVWQRGGLQGELLATELAYWKRQLCGLPATLNLPADGSRTATRDHSGARQTVVLAGELTGALYRLGRHERATLFMTLLGAFQILLHRYTGAGAVAVGTPVANRRRMETEPLIGFFANTLVLRADLAGDPTIREFLERTRESVLGAYDHQDFPFEKVVEALRPERSLGRTPFVDVMFTLEEGSEPALALPGVTSSPIAVDTGTAKFDLTVAVRETPADLRVSVGYDTGLYEPATIRRMLGHYETLLRGIVADPGRRVSQLPLLTGTERQQLLVEWNATQRPFPQEACLSELFEHQVTHAPDTVAVTGEGQSLTYRELNERANRFAHILRARGVGPDAVVGVCLQPSVDLIVALLSVLKAGGAYLPLDPSYPQERLAFMLRDAQAVAVVTHPGLVPNLPAAGVPIVTLDEASSLTERTDNPRHETTGMHLAYLMYTSGSTGEPKAVAVPQRAVLRLVCDPDYVTVASGDVVAQASTVAFDAATFEIWGALLNGARLVVLTRDTVLAPAEFAKALSRHGVTVLFLTTALFNQMAREAPGAFRSLRTLLVGGERAEPEWFAAVLRAGPPERLVNVYGPTEATTFASWQLVKQVGEGTSLLIGRPIQNTRLYVLDGEGSPVPIGVPGELYIGGPGVARGYHGRPELTAAHFTPDPFSAEAGGRLYKTGDIVRYRADGAIEFLGRRDDQVKIRGHRIEPGEVEAVLRQHHGVREALVLARKADSADTWLVAYVVPVGPAMTAALLLAFLRERLPGYMIPGHVVLMERFPLAANGKVDRRQLPAPEEARSEQSAGFVPPSTPLERQLAQVWEEILGIRPIGTRDNFFDLGGHSLLAVRLMRAIEVTLARRLPFTTLFAGATIEHLAQTIQQDPAAIPWSSVTGINTEGLHPPLFFLPGDYDGGGFYCLELSRMLGREQPLYVLHAYGSDGRPFPVSIEAMATDYLPVVRAHQPHGPYRIGGYCNGGLVAFEMARRLRAEGELVDLLVLVEATVGNTGVGSRILRVFVDACGALGRLAPRKRQEWFVGLRQRALRARRQLRRGLRGLFGTDHASSGISSEVRPYPATPLDAYRRVFAAYVPGRYDGAITLVRTAADEGTRHDLRWRAVAREVQVHLIPGDHLSCLTEHVAALGECLAECLRNVRKA